MTKVLVAEYIVFLMYLLVPIISLALMLAVLDIFVISSRLKKVLEAVKAHDKHRREEFKALSAMMEQTAAEEVVEQTA